MNCVNVKIYIYILDKNIGLMDAEDHPGELGNPGYKQMVQ